MEHEEYGKTWSVDWSDSFFNNLAPKLTKMFMRYMHDEDKTAPSTGSGIEGKEDKIDSFKYFAVKKIIVIDVDYILSPYTMPMDGLDELSPANMKVTKATSRLLTVQGIINFRYKEGPGLPMSAIEKNVTDFLNALSPIDVEHGKSLQSILGYSDFGVMLDRVKLDGASSNFAADEFVMQLEDFNITGNPKHFKNYEADYAQLFETFAKTVWNLSKKRACINCARKQRFQLNVEGKCHLASQPDYVFRVRGRGKKNIMAVAQVKRDIEVQKEIEKKNNTDEKMSSVKKNFYKIYVEKLCQSPQHCPQRASSLTKGEHSKPRQYLEEKRNRYPKHGISERGHSQEEPSSSTHYSKETGLELGSSASCQTQSDDGDMTGESSGMSSDVDDVGRRDDSKAGQKRRKPLKLKKQKIYKDKAGKANIVTSSDSDSESFKTTFQEVDMETCVQLTDSEKENIQQFLPQLLAEVFTTFDKCVNTRITTTYGLKNKALRYAIVVAGFKVTFVTFSIVCPDMEDDETELSPKVFPFAWERGLDIRTDVFVTKQLDLLSRSDREKIAHTLHAMQVLSSS